MSTPKTAFLFCLAAGALRAQTIDLNSLSAAASRFASGGMQSQPLPLATDLRLMRGELPAPSGQLMTRATDVQAWTLFYDVSIKGGGPAADSRPHSASLKCTHGQFSDFTFSTPPIPGCKSMENTWFAISLDGAIAQLNTRG
jgi:hypothetical protein